MSKSTSVRVCIQAIGRFLQYRFSLIVRSSVWTNLLIGPARLNDLFDFRRDDVPVGIGRLSDDAELINQHDARYPRHVEHGADDVVIAHVFRVVKTDGFIGGQQLRRFKPQDVGLIRTLCCNGQCCQWSPVDADLFPDAERTKDSTQ